MYGHRNLSLPPFLSYQHKNTTRIARKNLLAYSINFAVKIAIILLHINFTMQ